MPPSGIRTHNLSRRDPRLRRRGHSDRQYNVTLVPTNRDKLLARECFGSQRQLVLEEETLAVSCLFMPVHTKGYTILVWCRQMSGSCHTQSFCLLARAPSVLARVTTWDIGTRVAQDLVSH